MRDDIEERRKENRKESTGKMKKKHEDGSGGMISPQIILLNGKELAQVIK